MAKYVFAIMGATGHIGQVISEELLKKGHKVKVLGRDARKLQELKAKGAEIFSGDFTDPALLSNVFKGCNAVFSFIPPAYKENDMEVFRENASEAIAHAIAKAKISHVVNLSSIGASESSGNGPIKELHLHEERLNTIPDLNLLHFRAGYFMENLFGFLPTIKKGAVTISSALKPDLRISMVATRDIGLKIAEILNALKFSGTSVFEFVGPQEITMTEAAKIIGKAIGKPDLKYTHLSYEQAEKELITMGMKHQISKLMVEMQRAFNEGKVTTTQKITDDHKGKTTLEAFSKAFTQVYRSLAA